MDLVALPFLNGSCCEKSRNISTPPHTQRIPCISYPAAYGGEQFLWVIHVQSQNQSPLEPHTKNTIIGDFSALPRCSMYDIFTYIYLQFTYKFLVHVDKHSSPIRRMWLMNLPSCRNGLDCPKVTRVIWLHLFAGEISPVKEYMWVLV